MDRVKHISDQRVKIITDVCRNICRNICLIVRASAVVMRNSNRDSDRRECECESSCKKGEFTFYFLL